MSIIGATAVGSVLALVVNHDPSSIPTDCPAGCLIIYDGAWYRKLSSGNTSDVHRTTGEVGQAGFSGGGSGFSGLAMHGYSGRSHSGYSGISTPGGPAGILGTYPGITLQSNSVTESNLADGCVRARNYAPVSIDKEKIAGGAVSSRSFQNGSVDENKMTVITDSSLASNSITTEKIKTGGIDLAFCLSGKLDPAALEAGAIQSQNIEVTLFGVSLNTKILVDGAIAREHIGSFDNDAFKDEIIDQTKFQNDSLDIGNPLIEGDDFISTEKIRDSSLIVFIRCITNDKISDLAVTDLKIEYGELRNRVFQNQSFDKDKIEEKSIKGIAIADNQLTHFHTKQGCVTVDKIFLQSVRNYSFTDSCITTEKLAQGAIRPEQVLSIYPTKDLFVYGTGADNYVLSFFNGILVQIQTVSS